MNELTKELCCIVVQGGIEVWVELERIEPLIELIRENKKGYFSVEGQLINSERIIGIFTPDVMEEATRRKNGQWRCKQKEWHERGERCGCNIKNLSGEELSRYSQGARYH